MCSLKKIYVPFSMDPILHAGYFIIFLSGVNISIRKKRCVHFDVSTCKHKHMQSDFCFRERKGLTIFKEKIR